MYVHLGHPRSPEFGELISGPGAGEVTIMIKTVASGLSDSDRGFRFVLTPVLNNIELDIRSYSFPEYTSGQFETILVTDLQERMFYTFIATAMNSLGSSGLANSSQVQAGECACMHECVCVCVFVCILCLYIVMCRVSHINFVLTKLMLFRFIHIHMGRFRTNLMPDKLLILFTCEL